jgi:hypothetical protein
MLAVLSGFFLFRGRGLINKLGQIGALVSLFIAGCSSVDERTYTRSMPPSTQKVIESAKYAAAEAKLAAPIEMTPLQEAHPVSPGEWVVCIKSMTPESRRYAIFFNAEAHKATRLAVQIDPCWAEGYHAVK